MDARILFLKVFLLLACPIASVSQNSQHTIRGSLKNTTGEAISNASVMLKNTETGSTVLFTRSDELGNFGFDVRNDFQIQDYQIVASHVSYISGTLKLSIGQWVYELILEDRDERIPEVDVGVRPQVTEHGDTLRYAVATFAKSEDRSIAEVLRRMPGIKVSDNGKVSFQGKEISNLYIDGVDLLNDRYGIATKAVPHRIVTDVEVLRNHQPISVLRERVHSDNVSLNLVISDTAQHNVSGDILIGGGLPHNYDIKSHVMQFHNRFKYLHVLRSNNVGDPIDEELFSGESGQGGDQYQLSLGRLGKPGLPRFRYYNNLSGLLSTSQHYMLRKNWKWKTSLDVFADRDRYSNHSRTIFYYVNDTTVLEEQIYQTMRPIMGQWAMSLYQNEPSRYIDFTSQIQYKKVDGDSFSQHNLSKNKLDERDFQFRQVFKYIPLLKGADVLTVQGNVSHGKQPSSLFVAPNEQWMELRRSSFDVTGKYLFFSHKIVQQQYEAGMSVFRDRLYSDLRLDPETEALLGLDGPFSNRLSWNQAKLYAAGEYAAQFRQVRLSMRIPGSLEYIQYRDPKIGVSGTRAAFFFTPDVKAIYIPVHGHEWQFQYIHFPQFSTIYGAHRGYIMLNHQDFRRMNTGIRLERSHQLSTRYTYANTPKLLMGYFSYSYLHTYTGSLERLNVQEDYLTYEYINQHNRRSNHNFSTGIDKYFMGWKTKAMLMVQGNVGHTDYLIDDILVPYTNRRFSIHPFMNFQSIGQLNWQYSGNIAWISQRSSGFNKSVVSDNVSNHRPVPGSNAHIQDHQFSVSYSHTRVFFATLRNHYIVSFSENQPVMPNYLADLNFRARLPKQKLDIELDIRNITNKKHFQTINLSEQFLYVIDYGLRSRQAVLSVSFSF